MSENEKEFVNKALLEYPNIRTDKLLETVNSIKNIMEKHNWNYNIEQDIYDFLIKEKLKKIRRSR